MLHSIQNIISLCPGVFATQAEDLAPPGKVKTGRAHHNLSIQEDICTTQTAQPIKIVLPLPDSLCSIFAMANPPLNRKQNQWS